MEQFQERLAQLAELSPEDLAALEAEVTEAFDAADAAADLESMQALADALDEIRRVKSGGESEPAEVAEVPEVEPAVAASATETLEPEASAEPTTTDETPTEPEADPEQPEQPPAPEPATEPAQPGDEPVTEPDQTEGSEESAVATEITADDVPQEHEPVTASARPITIRAGGDIPGLTAGALLPDMDGVNDAMLKKINAMRGVKGGGEHIVVASIALDDPDEDRTLRAGDLNGNARKIRELMSDKEQLTPEGLVAAGWCAPRTPIYDVPTMGTTSRPVRDSLPSYNADRGGITWATPPNMPTADFGVGIWRYEDDAWGSYTTPDASDAVGETKPCFTIECGEDATADVEALTLCLCFNNMMVRAFPEWVRANTDLVMVAQARFAEQVALSQMFGVAATGDCGELATSVGVARDFLSVARMAATKKRWELRLDPDAPMQMLAPSWLAEAIAIDLGLQQPGDDTYGTSRSEINGHLSDANLSPIWYIDDAPGTAAYNDCDSFPANVHWLMYPTGTFLRLDTGELNLGVVRTKEDLERNAYCEFSETFETVAYMGPANKSWVTRGLTTVNLYGSSGAPIDLTA